MKNKIIINHEKEVKSSYEEVLSQYYSSSVDRENFKDSIVMDKLNSWVAGETYNLIPRLFDESFDPETVLVLVNILYFKGSWIEPFLVSNTIQDIFHNLDGTKSTVDMMNSPDSTFHFSDMLDENLKVTLSACFYPKNNFSSQRSSDCPIKEKLVCLYSCPHSWLASKNLS